MSAEDINLGSPSPFLIPNLFTYWLLFHIWPHWNLLTYFQALCAGTDDATLDMTLLEFQFLSIWHFIWDTDAPKPT